MELTEEELDIIQSHKEYDLRSNHSNVSICTEKERCLSNNFYDIKNKEKNFQDDDVKLARHNKNYSETKSDGIRSYEDLEEARDEIKQMANFHDDHSNERNISH